MYNSKFEIGEVHLEVTTKCQARCPMCPRRVSGGGVLNPFMDLEEISYDSFVNWFSLEFLDNLYHFFMCGKYGDPIIAKDFLEIFEYVRSCNNHASLEMHTNGSGRSKRCWERLAESQVKVVFGIDGLRDTHALYRVNTDWDKLINNAQTFIDNGGEAEWHMLVFKHNEHQIEECRQMAYDMGFTNFEVKHTTRWKDDHLNVIDSEGRTKHVIEPSQESVRLMREAQEQYKTPPVCIQCKAKQAEAIYISANGNVTPCPWLALHASPHSQESRIDYMDKVGYFPNLYENTLDEIMESDYFNKIERLWSTGPLKECSKHCGSFDKMNKEFVERSREN